MDKISALLSGKTRASSAAPGRTIDHRYTPLSAVKKVLSKRKQEFVNLLTLYQKKAGLGSRFDPQSRVPLEDFKACLKAFSIRVDERDLKKYERTLECAAP